MLRARLYSCGRRSDYDTVKVCYQCGGTRILQNFTNESGAAFRKVVDPRKFRIELDSLNSDLLAPGTS